MDKNKLKEDLGTMPLEDVCKKYNLSFSDLFKLSKSGLYTYIDEDDTNSYIVKTRNNMWRINKSIDGENIYFGLYNTKKEALLVRDELIKHNWDKNKLDEILLRLGVEKR